MTDVKPSSCPNCGYDLSSVQESEFCPRCGQKQFHSRFRVRLIVQEFFSVVFNLEKGLLYTLINLFTHPGEVVNGYWNGLTRRYYNPIRYAFVMVTLSTLVTLSTGAYDQQVDTMSSSDGQMSWIYSGDNDVPDDVRERQMEINRSVQRETKKYLSVFSLALIPLGALSIWIVYRKKKILYGEALIATAYYIGHTSLIAVPFTFVSAMGWLTPGLSMLVTMSIYTLFGMFMLKQTFESSWLNAILKSILALLLAILIFSILLIFTSIVIGLVMIFK